MRLIDLTLPLYTGMPVYPGDPEVSIEKVLHIDKDGWDMRRIEINSHDATHVNAQAHGVVGGKSLDEYPLERFRGPAMLYDGTMSKYKGVLFRDQNIDTEIAQKIKEVRPLFVGLSTAFEFDTEIEKDLLQEDILLFERLANMEQLPQTFDFYGMPLHIREGDSSPVRAFAVIH